LSSKVAAAGSGLPPGVEEIVLLDTLKTLLTVAIRSLSQGEPEQLMEVSRQIRSAADQSMAAAINLGQLPTSIEAQQQRQKLLAELRQQRCFCRAILRRWRRSIFLRQQLLQGVATAPYTDSLEERWY